jgi:hypothetical protein
MRHLNQEKVAQSGWGAESIPSMQVAVYVMCGGGFLGRFAAEQPMDFYIDDRVGHLGYSREEIYQAVETLKTIVIANGMDPHRLPAVPSFHNMGIF